MAKHKSLCQGNDTNLQHVSGVQILSILFARHNIIYNNKIYIILWCRGVVVISTHRFIQLSLNLGSAKVQTLLLA